MIIALFILCACIAVGIAIVLKYLVFLTSTVNALATIINSTDTQVQRVLGKASLVQEAINILNSRDSEIEKLRASLKECSNKRVYAENRVAQLKKQYGVSPRRNQTKEYS